MRTVVLTNEEGADLGSAEIIDAHTGEGKLHKAFSVFLLTPDKKKVLLQQRSKEKMLFPMFWANTCCSHPFEGEAITDAGTRRLQEELGIDVPLEACGSFVYRAEDPNGSGVEHEYDTVLRGEIAEDTKLTPDPAEIHDVRWVEIETLQKELKEKPEEFSPWLPLALNILTAQHG